MENKSAVSQAGQVINNSSTTSLREFHQAEPLAYVEVHLWDIDDRKMPGFYTARANGL